MSVVGTAVAMHVLVGIWWIGAVAGLLPIANLLLASQREMAWRKGAEGERAVGRAIDKLASTRALHGRRIPGSRANIDHILIAPTGVWTIDAKNYTGKLETRRRGRELWIKGRDRSKLLEQARRQTAIVTDVLATAGLATVPVRPALCLLGVEWPLLFTPRNAGDVDLLSPRHLSTLLVGAPVLSASQIDHVAVTLDRELRPAASPATPRSASSRTASSRPPGAEPTPDPARDVTVKPWKRYGKDRLCTSTRPTEQRWATSTCRPTLSWRRSDTGGWCVTRLHATYARPDKTDDDIPASSDVPGIMRGGDSRRTRPQPRFSCRPLWPDRHGSVSS